MPTIQKLEKKPRPERNDTPRRDLRKKAYADRKWRRLRDWYISLHPLCEVCLSKGIVHEGESVHHKKSPFKGDSVDWNLMLDDKNLQTVCRDCHGELHAEEQGNIPAKKMIEILDSLFEDIEDEDK